ncbi:MAG: biopolymer transporter ExbD [Muribaculaceae bacterium]|nr:biopolymer transporter ExbD [Muribaculaceae bacterium]
MAKNLSRQKKLDTRIDFTPMVDMNMLLITFFMFCTTMLKPQTLQIALPFHDDKQQ